MLMDEFFKWKKYSAIDCKHSEEELFSLFFQEHEAGHTFFQMICNLAYEIMELQVCVEGLIEDSENVS